jgi:hypothetical protein
MFPNLDHVFHAQPMQRLLFAAMQRLLFVAMQTYHIQVFKAALHQAADWAASAAPREVAIVLHGNICSSTALHLGAASSTSANLGVRSFTVVSQPDTFQVKHV